MTRTLACVLALVLPLSAAAAVRVATTTTALGVLVRDIGGPHVEVTPLSAAGEDPHFVDPRPSLLVSLSRADLLVAVGLELEVGWLPTLQTSARNPKIAVGGAGYVEAAQFVDRLEVPAVPIDRSLGDLHPGGNPHFMYDPRAAAKVALGVAERLAATDPERAATYRSNAQGLAGRLLALATAERAQFAALPAERRRVVVYHASFPYLIDWLGLEQVATVEPKPGVAPDPGHVARVLSTMRATGSRVVLQEGHYPRGTSEALAKMAGARLVVLPGNPSLESDASFEQYGKSLAEAIHAAMRD